MSPQFSHTEPGTPEDAWHAALEGLGAPAVDVPGRADGSRARRDHLLVVAAHPDDETLGAGGLIAMASAAGARISVVVATSGERSHPTVTDEDLPRHALRREQEVTDAVRTLAPQAQLRLLRLPDGDLTSHEKPLLDALVATIRLAGPSTLVVAPWRHDGHPDHEAAGRTAALACRRTDATLLEYPIWLWHWGTAQQWPSETARALPLPPEVMDLKDSAISCHASQIQPQQPGDSDVMLGEHILDHFRRPVEVFLTDPEPVDDLALDSLHRDTADPWSVETSDYERRKRTATIRAAGPQRFGRALEVGCSIGALTAEIAARADTTLGIDASPAALARATERLAGDRSIELRACRAPHEWPDGEFDLQVVSEVGYFLSPAELDHLVRRVLDTMPPSGRVVLCHWRHQPDGWPLNGDLVHEAFLRAAATENPPVEVAVATETADYLLHALHRPE